MVAMHMAQQHAVDLPQPFVLRPAHRAPGVIKDARAVRVLENHRPVEGAELAGMAAQGRDLDVGRMGGRRRQEADADGRRRQRALSVVHGWSLPLS